jgi:putative transposase
VLVRRLQDKAPGRVVKINPCYTSQTCHACGHRAPDNRESQAVFRCVACGHRANADVNAAENIRDTAIKDTAVGRTVAARGALQPPGGATNREPQLIRLS